MSLKLAANFAVALAMLAITTTAALATERQAFDEKAFAAAQTEGKSILVDIAASWCPTCKAQKPIIEKLAAEPQYKNLLIFEVDFDARKDVLRKFGARVQSTLIVFKGDKETGRSVGSTDESAIGDLLRKAL
jgi:thioredoxin 1